MTQFRVVVILVCLVTLSGCASVPSPATYDVDALGESLVRTICGKEPPSGVETVRNPHVDGVLDTIERRACAMGSATLYVSSQASNPSGLAMDLKIRQPGSGVPNFLEIGNGVSGAARRLGQPTSQKEESVTYVFGDYENEFTIEAPGGVIRSLAWSWSLD